MKGGVSWRQRAQDLKRDMLALYFACVIRASPGTRKRSRGCIVAYAFSPIDLIPDPIPVLGYLDDLV